MKASDLRKSALAERKDELFKLRKEQSSLRMQQATGQLARPDQFQKVRRNIARVKTVIRELGAAAGEQS